MNQDPLRIAEVSALPLQRLQLTFQDGQTFIVDLSKWISSTQSLQTLSDPTLFAQAKKGEWGAAVVWIEDTLDLGADNLRNLAVEQSGGIGHERLLT